MTNHDRIVAALTKWDIIRSKKDKFHNRHFLGITLGALKEAEKERKSLSGVIEHAFEGRLRDFLLQECGVAVAKPKSTRRK